MNPIIYSFPSMFSLNTEVSSYSYQAKEAQQHALNLEKQFFSSQLLKQFYIFPILESVKLEVLELQRYVIKSDNEFEPSEFESIYDFNVSSLTIIPNEKMFPVEKLAVISDLSNSFNSFKNNISLVSQKKILYWAIKIGRENDYFCQYNQTRFSFDFSKTYIESLCQSAYGENYNFFNLEILQSHLENKEK